MTLHALRPLGRVLLLTATLALAGWAWGGWAVVTLDDLPTALVRGKPTTLTFIVRQHGHTPLDNLRPSIDAVPVRGGDHILADAVPAGGTGRYSTTFTLPDTGQWRLTINSGWGKSSIDLEPIAVIAAGQPAPEYAAAQRGRQLFAAKGCMTCHLHGDVAKSGAVSVGPVLTNLRLPADFLQKFLADPSILPAAQQTNGGMPNLDLKPAEIMALVAFINAEGTTTRVGQ